MGSDDTLEPGAVSAWLDTARATGAAAVIAPVRYRGGPRILTPRARVFRGPLVDPLRDRLAYRTAPLGLIRREALSRLGLRLSQGLRTGEDLEFGLRLWFSGEKIAYPAHAPAYLVGQDADERVTSRRAAAGQPVPGRHLAGFRGLVPRRCPLPSGKPSR